MNENDQNINKDMIECELIDVNSLDFNDDQTWLYTMPEDSGHHVDIIDWNLSCHWPGNDDPEYLKCETQLFELLDDILKNEYVSLPDKHKFDSRTYVRPKRRPQRPSVHSVLDIASSQNKFLTYNKYNHAPILRLKTFNVDTDSDNSVVVKDYALKRRSLVQDEDQQQPHERISVGSVGGEGDSVAIPSKPIDIDLSQPAHNVHNTFNKGFPNNVIERGSLGMYRSGESLMRMSPPSLVSSLLMDSSDTFNQESLDSRKSILSQKDSGVGPSGRESRDPMMTSMTLSILDEKDMSTSFLSQTTYPDNDSLIDSLPPSLISSVNSSVVASTNASKIRSDSAEPNLFSSATFTHLEQSEKLLSGRPRLAMYNSYTKRDSNAKNTDKSQEVSNSSEISNHDVTLENKPPIAEKISPEMGETITLHYTNNKFHDEADKENLNDSFQKDEAFYKDMGLQKPIDIGKNSLNVTLDKRELNEIIQARQKLSLARKNLPVETEKAAVLPNQADGANKTIQVLNQTITVPKQSMENASELLARRRFEKRIEDGQRETPKRNTTFKISPRLTAMDATVVYAKQEAKTYTNMIDINSATLNLIDATDKTNNHEAKEWSGERAMVYSSETDTDTGTFSSSSPPDVNDTTLAPHHDDDSTQVASTPLAPLRKNAKNDLLSIHNTISPILDQFEAHVAHHVEPPHNTTVINSATIVRRHGPQRDIIAGKMSIEGRRLTNNLSPPKTSPNRLSPTAAASYTAMGPPVGIPRKTGLPTSKMRQYSSHKDLSRIPGAPTIGGFAARSALGRGAMVRRNVYASNPALSPTAPAPSMQIAFTNDVQVPNKSVPRPPLVRQGTETLRRERPQSQLIAPKETSSRPYSIAGASQLRIARPAPPANRPTGIQNALETRPSTAEPRASALPRPSRLPAPRRRPPSVYSVAPSAEHLEQC